MNHENHLTQPALTYDLPLLSLLTYLEGNLTECLWHWLQHPFHRISVDPIVRHSIHNFQFHFALDKHLSGSKGARLNGFKITLSLSTVFQGFVASTQYRSNNLISAHRSLPQSSFCPRFVAYIAIIGQGRHAKLGFLHIIILGL